MPPKGKETSEAQRVQVIKLQEKGYNFLTITERTGIPKSTCYDIIKRDHERREPLGELHTQQQLPEVSVQNS